MPLHVFSMGLQVAYALSTCVNERMVNRKHAYRSWIYMSTFRLKYIRLQCNVQLFLMSIIQNMLSNNKTGYIGLSWNSLCYLLYWELVKQLNMGVTEEMQSTPHQNIIKYSSWTPYCNTSPYCTRGHTTTIYIILQKDGYSGTKTRHQGMQLHSLT